VRTPRTRQRVGGRGREAVFPRRKRLYAWHAAGMFRLLCVLLICSLLPMAGLPSPLVPPRAQLTAAMFALPCPCWPQDLVRIYSVAVGSADI